MFPIPPRCICINDTMLAKIDDEQALRISTMAMAELQPKALLKLVSITSCERFYIVSKAKNPISFSKSFNVSSSSCRSPSSDVFHGVVHYCQLSRFYSSMCMRNKDSIRAFSLTDLVRSFFIKATSTPRLE